jgi:hypothetical protein
VLPHDLYGLAAINDVEEVGHNQPDQRSQDGQHHQQLDEGETLLTPCNLFAIFVMNIFPPFLF